MRAIALALASTVITAAGDARAQQSPADPRRDAMAKELMLVAAELRRDIGAGSGEAILARVPPAGLRCGKRVVPRAKVASDLLSPTSWVHGALFGGQGYAARPGAPASLAAFLRSEREIAIEVTFQDGGGPAKGDRACVDFRAEGVVTPGVPFCFERQGADWWLVDSLYPCG